jgi:excisionase family DNA binding protein
VVDSRKTRRPEGSLAGGDLKVSEVAEDIGVDPGTVYEHIRRGWLEAYRLGGGKARGNLRITRAALDAYKARGAVRPEPHAARPRPVSRSRNAAHRAALARLRELGV